MVGIRQKRWNQNSFHIDSLSWGHLEGWETDKREPITHLDGACDFHSWMHEGDCRAWDRDMVGSVCCYHKTSRLEGEFWSLTRSHCVSYGNISHWVSDLKTWALPGPIAPPYAAPSCFFSLPGDSHHFLSDREWETWSWHSTPPGRRLTLTWARSYWTHWD